MTNLDVIWGLAAHADPLVGYFRNFSLYVKLAMGVLGFNKRNGKIPKLGKLLAIPVI